MFKKAFQQGRSERRIEAYAVGTLRPWAMRERSWRTFSTSWEGRLRIAHTLGIIISHARLLVSW